MPTQLSFIKIGTDSFFIGTYYQVNTFDICAPNETSTVCMQSGMRQVEAENYFNLNADASELYVDIRATAEEIGFDSSDPSHKDMQYFVHAPDGDTSEVDKEYRRGGLNLKLPMSYIMKFAKLDGGLNGLNAGAGVSTSIGKARHRMVGLKMTISLELRNQIEQMQYPPKGRIFGSTSCHIYASIEADWNRVPSAFVFPTRKLGQIKLYDVYGLRITVAETSHGMHLFSPVKFIQACTNMVVLWGSVRIIVSLFSLRCLGKTSKKWRNALSRNVETHVLINRNTINHIRRRHEVESHAREIVLKLGRELAIDAGIQKSLSKNGKTYKYSKHDRRKMFSLLDENHNGLVTEEELKAYLSKKQISFTEITLECVMNQLDRNGNATFELGEFKSTIGRALREKKYHTPVEKPAAWHGCCCCCCSKRKKSGVAKKESANSDDIDVELSMKPDGHDSSQQQNNVLNEAEFADSSTFGKREQYRKVVHSHEHQIHHHHHHHHYGSDDSSISSSSSSDSEDEDDH